LRLASKGKSRKWPNGKTSEPRFGNWGWNNFFSIGDRRSRGKKIVPPGKEEKEIPSKKRA